MNEFFVFAHVVKRWIFGIKLFNPYFIISNEILLNMEEVGYGRGGRGLAILEKIKQVIINYAVHVPLIER